jgi:hypothetical protein
VAAAGEDDLRAPGGCGRMIEHRLPSRRLLGALVGLVAALALPAPAGAFLRDVELLQPSGVVRNNAALPISCFNGKALVGMGADIHPVVSRGGLGINRMWPQDGRADQALVSSANTDFLVRGLVWGTSGAVTCAGYTDTPPTTANGGPYLKDPVVVRKASVFGSSQLRIVDADCAERRPIGGGFRLLSSIRPGYTPEHVIVDRAEVVGRFFRVIAHETQPIRERWSLAAYAICVNDTSPSRGPEYIGPGPLIYTRTSEPGPPLGSGRISGGCGPGNFYPIAAGARVTGASTTAPPPPQVVLTELEPAQQRGSVRPNFWNAEAVAEHRTLDKWRLQVKTICVPLVAAGA